MARLRFVTGFIMFALAGADASLACSTCSKAMTLDRRQVACLEQWLPAYLSEPTDPVIVSLLDCGQPQQAFPRDAHSDTVINPTVAKDGDKDAAEKIYFLTKKQLECLKDNLEPLKRSNAEKVTFEFSRCAG